MVNFRIVIFKNNPHLVIWNIMKNVFGQRQENKKTHCKKIKYTLILSGRSSQGFNKSPVIQGSSEENLSSRRDALLRANWATRASRRHESWCARRLRLWTVFKSTSGEQRRPSDRDQTASLLLSTARVHYSLYSK